MSGVSSKKPYIRSVSFGNVFKRRKETRYRSWDEEDGAADSLIAGESPFRTRAMPNELEEEEEDVFVGGEGELAARCASSEGMHLADCFYLGSYDMTGMSVQGRGCIDVAGRKLWERTQEELKPLRRKNSLPARLPEASDRVESSARPKYVKLFATKNHLRVVDDHTGELMAEFSYKKISFVGTHPKHNRLFAFIGEPRGKTTPFCYAFKCEDSESAARTARTLSQVFQERIKQLKAQMEFQISATALLTN